jgi:hypothetical protein
MTFNPNRLLKLNNAHPPGSDNVQGAVMALGERSPKEQPNIIGYLRIHRKLPRWFKVSTSRPTMTVPREPTALAAALVRRLKREEMKVFRKALQGLLRKPRAQPFRPGSQRQT